jgi:hypothetical protein
MGLTTKQELFSKLVALDGLSASEAYRQIYDSNPSNQSSIHEQSSKLMSNSKVSTRIIELRDSVTSEMVANVAWTKERFIKEAEANLIQSRDLNQMNPANTSLQLIGRVTQILEDKPMNQVNIGIVETLGKLPETARGRGTGMVMGHSAAPVSI